MKTYPVYRVKLNKSSTFGNPAGQTLYVQAGSIGTVQARKGPVVYTPESDPNNWLIDVKFNGQHIVIPAKGPIYDGDLKSYFLRNEFTFLPDKNISVKADAISSSYLGENVISQEKEENLKNAFAVIGALFIALIIYVYIMEFKNLQ